MVEVSDVPTLIAPGLGPPTADCVIASDFGDCVKDELPFTTLMPAVAEISFAIMRYLRLNMGAERTFAR